MTKNRLAWIAMLSALTVAGSVGAVACSDNTTTGDDEPAVDAGTKDSGTKDSGTDATVPPTDSGTDGGTVVDDAGACLSKLRPTADGGTPRGPFCPFVTRPDGGTGVNCAPTETCCSGGGRPDGGGFDPSSCVSGQAAACPAASPGAAATQAFECTQTSDCASKGGGVCCVISNGADAGVGFANNANSCNVFTRESGTRCKASCGAGEYQGCQADSDCPAGKVCTLASAGSGDRIDMGYCK